MKIIEKTVEIPKDRHLKLDLELPSETPLGEVNIQLTIIPTVTPEQAWANLREIAGILKDDPAFQGNSVEIQSKMRDE
ncbi:MAG: hypothetical protein LBT62_03730 [Deltaproteobacteria bacterium]|jgi:hypothetical protein|nr:hypothetical protein [Deltaproteobacteria bacterium]